MNSWSRDERAHDGDEVLDTSPFMGIYRYRTPVDGRNAWYGIDAAGVTTELLVADFDETDAMVVDRLSRRVYGPRDLPTGLTVLDGGRTAAPATLLRTTLDPLRRHLHLVPRGDSTGC